MRNLQTEAGTDSAASFSALINTDGRKMFRRFDGAACLVSSDFESSNFMFDANRVLHLTLVPAVSILVCTSLPRRFNSPAHWFDRCAGFTDGAKIYLCNWRCGLFSWQGRCCLLYRL